MPHATRPGDVLGSRYRLVDLLTESAGGRFWRAHDPVLERHVAIHVIRGDDARAPALMDAARRSATVPDRRFLRVLDAECTDDECYVVNEWGWGTSLDIVVAGGATLSPRLASWLVAEVADSVATAHAVGVAHGRLNPENVLVDRGGGVRLIGSCVDAALHGLDPAGAAERDLDDLAGLLYCALTARWAGASDSLVAPAPRSHGEVLRPRQVRAGVPRPLDLLCDEVLHPSSGSHRDGEVAVTTARMVADVLLDFVGDTTGLPEALLASVPDVLPDEEQVVLPPVPELQPHDPDPDPEPRPRPARRSEGPERPEKQSGRPRQRDERPTEAGMPIFGDGVDDVDWLVRRSTPPAPPPPFETPPERPLFAPAPLAGPVARPPAPARPAPTPAPPAPTPSEPAPRQDGGFWPWETGAGSTTGTGLRAVRDEPVPGRGFLRVAALLALLLLVGVGVVVVVSLDGRSEAAPQDDSTPGVLGDPGVGGPGDAAPERGERLAFVTDPQLPAVATAYDPQGDPPSENDEDVPLATDGDAGTGWSTSGYDDQLGPPPGLKYGVGLLLDLGGVHRVSRVELALVGTPTSVSVFVTDGPPRTVDGLQPAAQGTADGDRLALDLPGVSGSHVVVWLTALPLDDDGRFRGTIADVLVRGG